MARRTLGIDLFEIADGFWDANGCDVPFISGGAGDFHRIGHSVLAKSQYVEMRAMHYLLGKEGFDMTNGERVTGCDGVGLWRAASGMPELYQAGENRLAGYPHRRGIWNLYGTLEFFEKS